MHSTPKTQDHPPLGYSADRFQVQSVTKRESESKEKKRMLHCDQRI